MAAPAVPESLAPHVTRLVELLRGLDEELR